MIFIDNNLQNIIDQMPYLQDISTLRLCIVSTMYCTYIPILEPVSGIDTWVFGDPPSSPQPNTNTEKIYRVKKGV